MCIHCDPGVDCAHDRETDTWVVPSTVRCSHVWEPLDLPDPMSAGAVIQAGWVCRRCGKEES